MSPTTPPQLFRRHRRQAIAVTAVVSAIAALGAIVGGSAGAVVTDARTQRAEVRARQAQTAAKVNALQGDQAQVLSALRALDANVRGQQAALTESRRQAQASTEEAAQADSDAAAAAQEVAELRARVARYAVNAYVDPPGDDLMRRFEAVSAQEDATRRALLEMHSRSDADVLEQLRATKQRLEEDRRRAEDARAAAEEHVAAAEAALTQLSSAKTQQSAFAEQVRERLDNSLSDAAFLGQMDATLGAQLAQEAAALASGLNGIPGNSSDSGGGTTTPVPPRPALTTVGGITVAVSIAGDLRNLLSAALSDGIEFRGYGYRDINAQIQLRRQNCGTSDYAIWQMPAESCRPPTARPGRSAHERGLAVDFMVGSSFINSYASAGFKWLAANAGGYGFVNSVPGEPWHWSHLG